MTLSERVYLIVHAFSDDGRRQDIRSLAADVRGLEEEVDRLREGIRRVIKRYTPSVENRADRDLLRELERLVGDE